MKNLKPFDLKRALAGDPVVTGDGRKVTQVELIMISDSKEGVLVHIEDYPNQIKWFTDKEYASDHVNDLFMVPKTTPKTTTYWVNIYRDSLNSICIGSIHKTQKSAESVVHDLERIKTISFDVEE